MIGQEIVGEPPPRGLSWGTVAVEAEILSTLERPAEPGERLEFAFRRKEAELLAVFDSLSIADSRELHRRLTLALADDPIAKLFLRLVPDRRQRLLAFLLDARRRAALRAAK